MTIPTALPLDIRVVGFVHVRNYNLTLLIIVN